MKFIWSTFFPEMTSNLTFFQLLLQYPLCSCYSPKQQKLYFTIFILNSYRNNQLFLFPQNYFCHLSFICSIPMAGFLNHPCIFLKYLVKGSQLARGLSAGFFFKQRPIISFYSVDKSGGYSGYYSLIFLNKLLIFYFYPSLNGKRLVNSLQSIIPKLQTSILDEINRLRWPLINQGEIQCLDPTRYPLFPLSFQSSQMMRDQLELSSFSKIFGYLDWSYIWAVAKSISLISSIYVTIIFQNFKSLCIILLFSKAMRVVSTLNIKS